MKVNALSLLLRQRRFDLIFKYLYALDAELSREAYVESIRAFNGFHEMRPTDGVPKDSAEDFISSFNRLISSVRANGFDESRGSLPIGKNGEICDGAHRLAACAACNCSVIVEPIDRRDCYDYRFFRANGMNLTVMDYGAVKFVELNPNARIVIVTAKENAPLNRASEEILERYGFVYYARQKTKACVFVFVCEDMDRMSRAMVEMQMLAAGDARAVLFCETHEESLRLARLYFCAEAPISDDPTKLFQQIEVPKRGLFGRFFECFHLRGGSSI